MNRITDKTLYDFCTLYRQQFGQIQDATRFKNELHMRFYGEDTKELFALGLKKRLYHLKVGNLIFLVNRRITDNNMKEIPDDDLRAFCKWCRFKGRVSEEVLVTCMCGHFHSFPKAMKEQLRRMQSLGLITVNKDKTITI